MTSRALFDAAFTIPDPGGSASSGYFLSDEFYVRYQWGPNHGTGDHPDFSKARQEGKWAAFGRLTDVMPGLPDDYSRDFDAACGSDPAHIYLIKNGKYIIYDFARKVLEQSEPQPVCGDQDSLFGAVPAGFQVTGSVAFIIMGEDGPERGCYLFGGRQVYRCNFDRGSAEGPYDVAALWPLLTPNGFGGRVDYALPNPDASTLYLFSNNGTYAETDPDHTAGDGTTGRNQPPTAFTNDTWRGMLMKTFDQPGTYTFYPHGNMQLTAHLWGAGGGGGACFEAPNRVDVDFGVKRSVGSGGNGGAGGYVTSSINYSRGDELALAISGSESSDSGGSGGGAYPGVPSPWASAGGNAGGYSQLYLKSDPSRQLVAGGGGGGGCGGNLYGPWQTPIAVDGGNGGSGGADGSDGSVLPSHNNGKGGRSDGVGGRGGDCVYTQPPTPNHNAFTDGQDGSSGGQGGAGWRDPRVYGQSGMAGGGGGNGGRSLATRGGGGGAGDSQLGQDGSNPQFPPQPSSGGGGGGGGGANMVAGYEGTSQTSPDRTPAGADAEIGYVSGAGVGGMGAQGAVSPDETRASLPGETGGGALVVLTWSSPSSPPPPPAAAPQIAVPGDGAHGVDPNVVFSGTADADTTSVRAWNIDGGAQIADAPVTGGQWHFTSNQGPWAPGQHAVRVKGVNNSGQSPEASVNFTVVGSPPPPGNAPSGAPHINFPTDGAGHCRPNTFFTGTAGADTTSVRAWDESDNQIADVPVTGGQWQFTSNRGNWASGDHRVTVRGVNSSGQGPEAHVSFTVRI